MKIAFKNHLIHQFPELCSQPFILACSAGIDSVVLAHLCKEIGLDFALAHCNFKLRGAASQADASFVEELAKQFSVPFFSTSFNTETYAKTQKCSVQMAARTLRYEWFETLIETSRYAYLVTAHHRDDALETMLINLSRGTGIEGLLGVPKKRKYIIRPMLPFSRQEIASYAKTQKIEWREDSSNKETKYLRNKIRHELLPLIESLHPTALHNVAQTQKYLEQTATLSHLYIDQLRAQLFHNTPTAISIDLENLLSQTALNASLYGLFSPYGFSDSAAIIGICEGASGKKLLSDTHILLKDRRNLLLYAKEQLSSSEEAYYISEDCPAITTPISMEFTDGKEAAVPQTPFEITVDKTLLHFPLVLRHIKEGDLFYPVGMTGKKKLSKYLRDEKIDVFSKSSLWILADAKDRIVWVVGLRADRRFQVHSKTNQFLCLKTLS